MTFAQAAEMNNQQALAAQLSARLEREHLARAMGQPAPLLDRVESVVPISMVDINVANFVLQCDEMGIESQPDNSERARA